MLALQLIQPAVVGNLDAVDLSGALVGREMNGLACVQGDCYQGTRKIGDLNGHRYLSRNWNPVFGPPMVLPPQDEAYLLFSVIKCRTSHRNCGRVLMFRIVPAGRGLRPLGHAPADCRWLRISRERIWSIKVRTSLLAFGLG
jgi:hypothetical protein